MQGRWLDGVDELALLVGITNTDFAVIDASPGFLRFNGCDLQAVLGRSLEQVLTGGAPPEAISRSAQKDVRDFCRRACGTTAMPPLPGSGGGGVAEAAGEAVAVQPVARSDDELHTVLSMLGLCRLQETRCALVVQAPLGKGPFVRTPKKERQKITEACRRSLCDIRHRLQVGARELGPEQKAKDSKSKYLDKLQPHHTGTLSHAVAEIPAFGFYRQRLQSHCVLSNGGLTATRREEDELHSGCLVFSDRPVPLSNKGLEFTLRIEGVSTCFDGFPMIGFTRRQPADHIGLYPDLALCLGQSVLVGTRCQASARDRHEHFEVGFKPPPQEEVQTWSLPAPQAHQAHQKLRAGDIVTCVYTYEGRVQFWLNNEIMLDFDVGRPVVPSSEYYAVIDVCFTVASVTLLPTAGAQEETLFRSECDSPKMKRLQEKTQLVDCLAGRTRHLTSALPAATAESYADCTPWSGA